MPCATGAFISLFSRDLAHRKILVWIPLNIWGNPLSTVRHQTDVSQKVFYGELRTAMVLTVFCATRRIIRAFLLEEQKIVKKVLKQQKAATAAAASGKKGKKK